MAQILAGQGQVASRIPTGGGVGGFLRRIAGGLQLFACTIVALSLLSWSASDPSLTHISSGAVRNWMGPLGAIVSDLLMQLLGVASIFVVLPPAYWAVQLLTQGHLANFKRKLAFVPLAVICLALAWSSMPEISAMPFRHGYGGVVGDIVYGRLTGILSIINATRAGIASGLFGLAMGLLFLQRSFGLTRADIRAACTIPALRTTTPPSGQTAPNLAPARSLPAAGEPQLPLSPIAPQTHQTQMRTEPQHDRRFAPRLDTGAPAWPAAPVASPPYATPHHAYPAPHSPQQNHYPAEWQPEAVRPDPAQYQRQPYPQPSGHVSAGGPGPARQAWLRPIPRRIPAAAATVSPGAVAPVSTSESDRLSATDRRHAPAFDLDTAQQSRFIAERFAPENAEVAAVSYQTPAADHAAAQRTRYDHAVAPMAVEPEPVFAAREPEIIMPRATEFHTQAPAADRTVVVAPGGYFARLTGNQHAAAPSGYRRPALNLLQRPATPARTADLTETKLRERSQLLLETLGDFGIKGDIVAVRPGPVVTLFEFEPARGTKSSRVIGLADDIARSMSARAVRIAVVPGVNAIGIELPNATREPVGFRDLLETEQFRTTDAKLPLALGKGIGGEPVIADLTRMPHLLVAGTTGSGKSVGVNAMILSLLFQLSPDDCRMIMIDPKMLELSVYNGIPHLLTPVVTEPNKAVAALNWAVGEMENRYRRMSALNVRNIEVFNARVRARQDVGQNAGQPDSETTPMPHIVIVVDEFADLMAVAGKEIEFAVQRLAQMARAAGIHLIMATQRPSVDIITGTIKANFPTRISFRVTSRIDSRTILNEQGAEQLLGQGDMLYAGGTGVVRVHGPFVSDEEVESIAAFLRTQGTPAYVDGITDVPDPEEDQKTPVIDEDHLYDRAVALVRADKKASISYLQRKLSISYNRAADIVDRMEADGLVSAQNSAGKREVLSPEPTMTGGPGPDLLG